jgi:DNA-binding MarR family transcriptional regulator
VNAVELYLLGRKLMKIAEEALPKPPTGGPPASVRMIVIDVAEHPDSSIGEITERTGFPQSHVSSSVARLRELGALTTWVDPQDRRRTLVRLAPGIRQRAQRAAVPVDAQLAAAVADEDPDALQKVIDALETLSSRMGPATVSQRAQSERSDEHVFFARRGAGRWKLIPIQLALLALLLGATFAFHISGTELVELRIARLIVFVAIVFGFGWFSRRRASTAARPGREHDRRPER